MPTGTKNEWAEAKRGHSYTNWNQIERAEAKRGHSYTNWNQNRAG